LPTTCCQPVQDAVSADVVFGAPEFEGEGHFPHLDEPGRFAEVLEDFLATTESAVGDGALLRERLARGAARPRARGALRTAVE